MGILGDVINYGTPVGWVGKGTGWYDAGKTVEDLAEQANPAAAAEKGQYGGVDRENYNLPGYQQRRDDLMRSAGEMQNRQVGLWAGNQDTNQWRGDQRSLADLLRRRAMGEDSLAVQQLREATDRNISQQQALAASARPGQQAMGARLAAQNAGRINQGFAGQAQQARLAEMQGATGQLGQVLQGARGQDIDLSQYNAGLEMQQRGLNQQGYLDLLRQEAENARAQQLGGMGYESQRGQRFATMAGQPTPTQQLLSFGKDALQAGAMASDRRLKTDVSEADHQADDFLRNLQPYEYTYKDQAQFGAGPRLGVMAQDVEKSALGKAIVKEDEHGKALHIPTMVSGLAAGEGRLAERVDALEKKKPSGWIGEPRDRALGAAFREATEHPMAAARDYSAMEQVMSLARRGHPEAQRLLPTLRQRYQDSYFGTPESQPQEPQPYWNYPPSRVTVEHHSVQSDVRSKEKIMAAGQKADEFLSSLEKMPTAQQGGLGRTLAEAAQPARERLAQNELMRMLADREARARREMPWTPPYYERSYGRLSPPVPAFTIGPIGPAQIEPSWNVDVGPAVIEPPRRKIGR